MMEEPVREEIQAPMSAGPVKAELELAEPELAGRSGGDACAGIRAGNAGGSRKC